MRTLRAARLLAGPAAQLAWVAAAGCTGSALAAGSPVPAWVAPQLTVIAGGVAKVGRDHGRWQVTAGLTKRARALTRRRRGISSPAPAAVLVLTGHSDVVYLRRAFAEGAAGYLVKEAADVELVQAVRAVASGRQYVHPVLGAALLHLGAGSGRPAGAGGELSERELEVLREIALGRTNAEIAAALCVSVRTIETHRAHIQQKLGARTRAELVARAWQAHLLVDDELP